MESSAKSRCSKNTFRQAVFCYYDNLSSRMALKGTAFVPPPGVRDNSGRYTSQRLFILDTQFKEADITSSIQLFKVQNSKME